MVSNLAQDQAQFSQGSPLTPSDWEPAITVPSETVPSETSMDRLDQPIQRVVAKLPGASVEPPSRQDPFEGQGYDPEAIAAYYRRRPLQVVARLVTIFYPLTRFFFNLWLDRRLGRSAQTEPERARQLRELLTHLGPAYIKIGQALSTRPDLVPPLFLEELTRLQDQLPPFPNDIAFHFIEVELGAPPSEIYAELSSQPVAAASLGQVYKGRLKTGETVAVKVQRPGLAKQITLDLYILRRLASLAKRYIAQIRSDLVGIMDEFGERIFEEMDYTHEAQNAQRFAQLYGQIEDIYIPHIYPHYTARRVLTMEWIEGIKLTRLEELNRLGIDPTHLIDIGVQCSLRQLLEHGFFHADPHPGNLLAMADGKLAYLDFGMMSEVQTQQRYGLIEAVVHMVNRDFEGLAQDYVKLEFLTPDTDLTPIIPALAEVFNNALGASVAELNFKSITDEFSALMYEYPFRVPAYYALIIRSLVTLEGIAINVDPEFKVLSKAYPYVAKRLLTDPAPELRLSLQELLFKDGSFRWNRLENLLRNARDNSEYDLAQLLDQTLEFLFSDSGSFLRDRLVTQLVNSLDLLGQSTLQTLTASVQRRFGWQPPAPGPGAEPMETSDLSHLMRILEILKDTQGFDASLLLTRIPALLVKPETQTMGQQVASGLAQRALARLIRSLLAEADRQAVAPPLRQSQSSPVALPPAS